MVNYPSKSDHDKLVVDKKFGNVFLNCIAIVVRNSHLL